MKYFLILIIIAMAVWLWWLIRKSIKLQYEVWRAKRDRTGMVKFLNRFTKSFSMLNELSHASDLVAHYIAEVLETDSLCIFKLEERNGEKVLKSTAVVGMFPPLHPTVDYTSAPVDSIHQSIKQDILACDKSNIFGRVALEKQSILIERNAIDNPEIKNSLCAAKIDSVIIAPMLMENQVTGVICAVNSTRDDYAFTNDDLRLLETLASQASLAHSFLGIYQQLRDQQRIGKELEVAQHIQESLLPSEAPKWGDYEIKPFNKPAKEVGGDYYDFVKIDDDRLLVVVADASGKGVPACMIMAMCRSSLHALCKNFADLNRLLLELNTILYNDTEGCHFITMACCLINKKTNNVEYARAGHTELLVNTPSRGTRVFLPSGPALGLLPEELVESFEVVKCTCQPNSNLLMFTDGITEACNTVSEEFGFERLKTFWQKSIKQDAEDTIPHLISEYVDQFTDFDAPSDDRTIVSIERVSS